MPLTLTWNLKIGSVNLQIALRTIKILKTWIYRLYMQYDLWPWPKIQNRVSSSWRGHGVLSKYWKPKLNRLKYMIWPLTLGVDLEIKISFCQVRENIEYYQIIENPNRMGQVIRVDLYVTFSLDLNRKSRHQLRQVADNIECYQDIETLMESVNLYNLT